MSVKGIYKNAKGEYHFDIDISYDNLVTIQSHLEAGKKYLENECDNYDKKILDNLKKAIEELDFSHLVKDKS